MGRGILVIFIIALSHFLHGCAGCGGAGSSSLNLADLTLGLGDDGDSGGFDDSENHAPLVFFQDSFGNTIQSIDIDLSVQSSVDLKVEVFDSDGDSTILDHVIKVSGPAGEGISWDPDLVSPSLYDLTLFNLSEGVYVFSAQATDAYGLPGSAVLSVFVTDDSGPGGGDLPVSVLFTQSDCQTPKTNLLVNGPLQEDIVLYANITDPEGAVISESSITDLQVQLDGVPVGATLTPTLVSPNCFSIALNNLPENEEAQFEVHLAATDGVLGNPDGEAILTLQLNLPPSLSLSANSFVTTAPATVAISAMFDADLFGDASITVGGGDSTTSFSPGQSSVSPALITFNAPNPGIYTFTVVAEDPQGLTATEYYVLTVEEEIVNTPPCIEFVYTQEVGWNPDDNDIRCAGTEDDDYILINVHAGDPYSINVDIEMWDAEDNIVGAFTATNDSYPPFGVNEPGTTDFEVVCDPGCYIDFQNLLSGGTIVDGIMVHVIRVEVVDAFGETDEDWLLIEVLDGMPPVETSTEANAPVDP